MHRWIACQLLFMLPHTNLSLFQGHSIEFAALQSQGGELRMMHKLPAMTVLFKPGAKIVYYLDHCRELLSSQV